LNKDDLGHQHVNYFTRESAQRTLAIEGLTDIQTALGASGNTIHVQGRKSRSAGGARADGSDIAAATIALKDFAKRLALSWKQEESFIREILNSGKSLGLYGGGFTTAIVCGVEKRVSYLDGDEFKHGKCWLPGLPKIRSPRSLTINPLDHLVVVPQHHFQAIVGGLRNSGALDPRMAVHRGFNH
jgi:hypothetical protein